MRRPCGLQAVQGHTAPEQSITYVRPCLQQTAFLFRRKNVGLQCILDSEKKKDEGFAQIGYCEFGKNNKDRKEVQIPHDNCNTGYEVQAIPTGHAQLKMVSDVYSHILDEDRRHNAEKMERDFYKKAENQSLVAPEAKPSNAATEQLVNLLNASPELAAQLLQMLTANQAGQAATA